MMSDNDIRAALEAKEISIVPFYEQSLEPASYDCRIGASAYSSTLKETLDLTVKKLIRVEPGEFAIVQTLERINLNQCFVGQMGLLSDFAKAGLLILSGPQIDPGFDGILKVQLFNLSPRVITLRF
jgi:dCTP deaminase